jgi:hypothetical protein
MPGLLRPRHIPTLPTAADLRTIKDGPQSTQSGRRIRVGGKTGAHTPDFVGECDAAQIFSRQCEMVHTRLRDPRVAFEKP